MNLYLLIYIKRYKLSSENKSPLFLRISINGKRVEIALKRTISPDLWDNKRQCVKGRSLEAQSINEQIRVFKRRIHDIYVNFVEREEFISAEKLKNTFLGVNTGRKTLVQAFTLQEPESQSSQYRKSRYRVNRSKLTIVNRLKMITPS